MPDPIFVKPPSSSSAYPNENIRNAIVSRNKAKVDEEHQQMPMIEKFLRGMISGPSKGLLDIVGHVDNQFRGLPDEPQGNRWNTYDVGQDIGSLGISLLQPKLVPTSAAGDISTAGMFPPTNVRMSEFGAPTRNRLVEAGHDVYRPRKNLDYNLHTIESPKFTETGIQKGLNTSVGILPHSEEPFPYGPSKPIDLDYQNWNVKNALSSLDEMNINQPAGPSKNLAMDRLFDIISQDMYGIRRPLETPMTGAQLLEKFRRK